MNPISSKTKNLNLVEKENREEWKENRIKLYIYNEKELIMVKNMLRFSEVGERMSNDSQWANPLINWWKKW